MMNRAYVYEFGAKKLVGWTHIVRVVEPDSLVIKEAALDRLLRKSSTIVVEIYDITCQKYKVNLDYGPGLVLLTPIN